MYFLEESHGRIVSIFPRPSKDICEALNEYVKQNVLDASAFIQSLDNDPGLNPSDDNFVEDALLDREKSELGEISPDDNREFTLKTSGGTATIEEFGRNYFFSDTKLPEVQNAVSLKFGDIDIGASNLGDFVFVKGTNICVGLVFSVQGKVAYCAQVNHLIGQFTPYGSAERRETLLLVNSREEV